jgi:hypothetical protein
MHGITAFLVRLVRSVFRVGIEGRSTNPDAELTSSAAGPECEARGWSSREVRIDDKPDWNGSFAPRTYRDEYRGDFDGGY